MRYFLKTVINKIKAKFFAKKMKAFTHPIQKISPSDNLNLKRLGSDYGGWTFVDDPRLYGTTIISAGLGEDASFDVEFAKKYNAQIIIIDPTPRAVEHYQEIINNIGASKTHSYIEGGKQPMEAYDLEKLSIENFVFVDRALWNTNTRLKFFAPKDPQHVSHSILNFQNSYSKNGSYIEVFGCTLTNLMEELNVNSNEVTLVKLDIEGAEIEVITDFINNGFRPTQVLVEYDELNIPSDIAYARVGLAHNKLLNNGYKCVYTNGTTDFLYLLQGDTLKSS